MKTIGDYCAVDFEVINDGSNAAKVINVEVLIPGSENKPVSYDLKGISTGDVLKVEEVKNVNFVLTYNDYPREEWEEIQEINLENIQIKIEFEKE